MTIRFGLIALAAIGGGISSGQETGTGKPLQIRAIVQDAVNPMPELFFQSQAGGTVKLNLSVEGLAAAQTALTTGGALNLYKSALIDPANPQVNLAATGKVPANASRAIAMIVPSPQGISPPYRMAFIEDDPKTFRWGESRIVNLTPVDFAMEVGDLKIKADGGKISVVPEITKVDEYKQAQANFYFKDGNAWVVAAERNMLFLNSIRRIFLIFKTPSAVSPDIRTIDDIVPAVIPTVR